MKSGKLRTADTSILRKVVWLLEVVYMSTGKLAEYDQLSIPLFVSGYLMVMSAEKETMHPHTMQHLQDIMADAELCGWEPVMVFHII